ncbi:MAG: hypothetical protein M9933_05220 [Chitinophagaceae bacterium]|nr:hypothetical protein [Chitinophagaceae bacterium]
MHLSTTLDAIQAAYIVTKDSAYLNDAIQLIDNIISTATISSTIPGNTYKYKDNYLGWISQTPDQAFNNEAFLFEGYVFQYITRFLYLINRNGWIFQSPEHLQWYNITLSFIEKNVWEKWITRSKLQYGSPNRIFLGVRTHMAAHWAGIALVLEKVSLNQELKNQCKALYSTYDLLLRRNLRINVAHPDAYTWNCTWDNTDGTPAKKDKEVFIQDVSHGNHVISYLITAIELESANWNMDDVNRFINTVEKIIYNPQNISFNDSVDGTPSPERPGWGNFQADGWIKLARYDMKLQNVYMRFAETRADLLRRYSQSLQYYANLALNQYYFQLSN